MADYREAPEVEALAREIISEHHKHLQSARIVYLFRQDDWEYQGKRVLGKAYRVTGTEAYFTGALSDEEDPQPADFKIVINEVAWRRMELYQQKALVDHELCHCGLGDNGWTLWSHDVEEFRAIIHRHGLWQDGLESFVRTGVDKLQQRSLFDRDLDMEISVGGETVYEGKASDLERVM